MYIEFTIVHEISQLAYSLVIVQFLHNSVVNRLMHDLTMSVMVNHYQTGRYILTHMYMLK